MRVYFEDTEGDKRLMGNGVTDICIREGSIIP